MKNYKLSDIDQVSEKMLQRDDPWRSLQYLEKRWTTFAVESIYYCICFRIGGITLTFDKVSLHIVKLLKHKRAVK
jgi:hypothetical protein